MQFYKSNSSNVAPTPVLQKSQIQRILKAIYHSANFFTLYFGYLLSSQKN